MLCLQRMRSLDGKRRHVLKFIASDLLLRFLVPINAVMILFICAAAGMLGITFRQESLDGLTAKANLITDLLSGSLSTALWSFDGTLGEDILKALAEADPDYVGGVIRDPTGAVFVQHGRIALDPAGLIVEIRPIFHERSGESRQLIGSIELHLSPKRVDRRLTSHMTMIALGVSFALLTISGLTFAVVRSIIRPITAITKAMQSLSRGAVDTTIPGLDRKDQIGTMAQALDVFKSNALEITIQKEKLQRLQRHSALILNSVGEGIIGLDTDGRVTFANWMSGQLLEMETDAMTGRDFQDLLEVERPEQTEDGAVSSQIVAAYRDGVALNIKNALFRRSGGAIFPADLLAAPIMEQDQVSGAVVVFRDATLRLRYEAALADQQRELERQVTERTAELRAEIRMRGQVESALRASQKRLKSITDNLFEGVLVVDRAGQLAFANLSARRMLGLDQVAGGIEGHPLDQVFLLRVGRQDVAFDASPWRQVITEGGTLRDDDALFITSAASPLAVAYACSSVADGDGHRTAIISFRDIAALKKAQREALQASRLATVGQLAAGIAHEINTPAQYVGDNLDFVGKSLDKLIDLLDRSRELVGQAAGVPLLADAVARFEAAAAAAKLPFLSREVPAAIRESRDGITQIGRIVLSMKEFSHPGTNIKTATDINRALDSTLTVSRNVWKSAAVVQTEFDPSLPPVLCHAGEMNQVFLNLIVNAAQAIEASGKNLPGQITISTTHKDGFVSIRIADNGTGVPTDLRERIFDPFFTTKDVGKGTGQGLAICRDVVQIKHGGTLDVDGIEGEGAVFTVRLPVGGDSREQKDEVL
jgi:PAS domain S-box-containing protein